MDYQCDIEKGEALFAEGKNEQALSIFKNILENQPNNHEALNNLGVLCHAKGNFDEAENYFLKALSIKNDYLDALMNLIDLYLDSKRWKEAATQLEKCIAIHPHDPDFYNQLGTLYLEMGNTVKAKEVLEKSLKLNPDQKVVRESLNALEKKHVAPKTEVREKRLNILFVQEAPCIRNYKMATALRSKGHRVSLAYTKARLSQMYKGLSDDVYDECIQLKAHRQLWDISKDYDIIHCHNEPDILTVAALAGDAAVVHDTHDLISLRANGDPDLSYFEGVANRGAAGRVYSTPHQMEEAKKLYGVNGPSLVYFNYVSEPDLPKQFLPKLSDKDGKVHIVYEGGIGVNGHRDFSSLLVDLANQGVHIHIYPAFYNEEIAQYFSTHKNIHYYHPLSPKQIMEAMTQYDFGIIPFNLERGNKRFLDSTIANKLFEYLAAGLAVITSPLKSYIEYFGKNPVGITFQNDKEIIENIPKLKEIAKKTDFSKQIFTYEREVTKLEKFYRAVANDNLPVRANKNSDEVLLARQHWKERGLVAYYFQEGRQSVAIVDAVKKLHELDKIESVLEFGCNVGRNLYCLRRDIGGLELLGLDINEIAVNAGRQRFQLPLSVGGEEELAKMEDGTFDVVFTVSVLDHIPQVESVIEQLLRVTKKYFIAIEPYVGIDKDAKDYAVADFSYFWDYPKLFSKFRAELLYDKPCPLSDAGLGPFYHLYVVKPSARQDEEKDSMFYDKTYSLGGWQKEYHKHYSERYHYSVWKLALSWIKALPNPHILEIGCGSGQFANMLFDNGITNYKGFDFSRVAIEMAKENNQMYAQLFLVDNAYTSELYDDNYNTVVVLEVLEHIENDLLLLERIRKGSTVIFSVPNFNSESHVRWFDSTSDILKRYENFLAFESIHEFNLRPYKNKIYLIKSARK